MNPDDIDIETMERNKARDEHYRQREWEQNVNKMYICCRTCNEDIPSEVLEEMREILLKYKK